MTIFLAGLILPPPSWRTSLPLPVVTVAGKVKLGARVKVSFPA